MKRGLLLIIPLAGAAGIIAARGANDRVSATGCEGLPNAEQLKGYLHTAPDSGAAGGLFDGRYEWGAVVNRQGAVCAMAASVDTAGSVWPGSRGIAMAKANTANNFSNGKTPLSTARLYTMSLPGHSLWGAGAGNPVNPECLGNPNESPAGKNCGGTIAFGGGVPLYHNNQVIGGLGVSGDTPCADHEIAKRVRGMLKMTPPGGNMADDITYAVKDPPSLFTHPLCKNTWRNGEKVGEEPTASRYAGVTGTPEPARRQR